jgi:hypothetical protein
MNIQRSFIATIAYFGLSTFAYAQDSHGHDHHGHGGEGFYGHLDLQAQGDTHLDGDWFDKRFSESYSHSHLELGYRMKSGFSINANIKLEGEASGHAHHGHGHGGDEHAGEEHHDEEEHADEDHHDEEEHDDEEHHDEEEHADEDHHDEEHGEKKAHPGDKDDKFFEDHPVFIAALTVNYDTENFSAYAGKFNPVVGVDYHSFPGMYISTLVEHYAIRERIGAGFKVRHDLEDFGRHSLEISSFMADTTFLSDSTVHQRGNTSKEDGGPSNTQRFNSYAISLEGSDFYSLTNNIVEGLSYRIGHAVQAAAETSPRDEIRYSVSVGYKHIFTRDLTARLMTEHMAINNLNGETSHDRSYNNLAIRFHYKNWFAGTAYTLIDNEADEEGENHDGHVFEGSAGYNFPFGLSVEVGYKRSDEENEEKELLGTLLKYSYEF